MILIVEDSISTAVRYYDMLRRAQIPAVIAQSADMARHLIETQNIKGAFLDLHIGPNETTFPLAELLDSKGILYVFLSASEDEEEIRACVRMGAPFFGKHEIKPEWLAWAVQKFEEYGSGGAHV
jgi:DNA-binding response OmpR family regulator